MCEHVWNTYVTNYSYGGGWEDFSDTMSGHHDGSFYNKCEKCNVQDNYQFYGLSNVVWGYNDHKFPGKITIEECMAVLALMSL